jgi:hypothetical protein
VSFVNQVLELFEKVAKMPSLIIFFHLFIPIPPHTIISNDKLLVKITYHLISVFLDFLAIQLLETHPVEPLSEEIAARLVEIAAEAETRLAGMQFVA